MRSSTPSIAIASLLLASAQALAQDSKGLVPLPDYSGDLWSRSHLAGDLNGGRSHLANKGLQLTLDWTQTAQTITSGGRDNDKAYTSNLDALIQLDLMRMGVMQGALVTIRAESRLGESVNGSSGSILPVNTDALFPLTDDLDENIPVAITNLYYTQFLSEKLAVFGGKIDTLSGDLNEFASGRGVAQFMNANFVFNSVLALRLPYSTLGLGVSILPTRHITIQASVFNTSDSSTTSGLNDFGDGYTATLEADFQYRLGALPGGCNVGGLYSWDQDFTQLGGRFVVQPGEGLAPSTKSSTWALYASAWQYLWILDPTDKPIDLANHAPDHRGLGLFARLGFADDETNPVEWSASVGLGGKGLIPSRERDTFGIGYFFTSLQDTRLSSPLAIDDQSQGAEAFYNVALTPAVDLTLDAQVVTSPFSSLDTAFVLGLRLNASF